MAIMQFSVIQGHHFWYQLKACCDFLSVNNTNLYPEYWSNFCCQQGAPLFNTLVPCKPLNCEIWPKETRHYYMVQCRAYCNILNYLGLIDRQMNSLVSQPMNSHSHSQLPPE